MLSASVVSSVSACGGTLPFSSRDGGGAGAGGEAALLLPLSGASAALGQRLQAAATLGGGPGIGIRIVDSGSTDETAASAARAAVDAGADMLVGPVFSAQAAAVGAAVRVPVLTLSNNAALAGGNTYVFGVTPGQSAQAVFSLAAQRNLRDVAVVVPPGEFGAQSVAAAGEVAQALGIALRPALIRDSAQGLAKALSRDGTFPQAVYLPAADATLAPFAEALRGKGMQLLGSTQWSSLDLSGRPAFREAWFAAPDPLRFAAFDDAYRQATGEPGGIITGLAFDGVDLLRTLRQRGTMNVRGLTREEGFTGVLGACRVLKSGLCLRGLGVLKVGAGEFSLIGSTSV